MDTADIVNRIIEKLGGNRVEFIEIRQTNLFVLIVSFSHAGNKYEARVLPTSVYISVAQKKSYQLALRTNAYTNWLEGVLNGMVRNDAGELVMP